MLINIDRKTLDSLTKASKLLSSEESEVYIQPQRILVNSVLPINNVIVVPLETESPSNEFIKLKLIDFLSAIDLLTGKSISIEKADEFTITISSDKRHVKVSNVSFTRDVIIPTDDFSDTCLDVLDQDIISVLNTHKKNFIGSSIKRDIDGIFFMSDFVLSTNEYSVLTSKLMSSTNHNLDIFLPSLICKLILSLKNVSVSAFLSIDKKTKRVRINLDKVQVFIKLELVQPNQVILENINNILVNATETMSHSSFVVVEKLLEVLDGKAIRDSKSPGIVWQFDDDKLQFTLQSNIIQFNSEIELENSSFGQITCNLPAEEIAKMLDVVSDYGKIKIEYDGNLLVQFTTKFDRFIVAVLHK